MSSRRRVDGTSLAAARSGGFTLVEVLVALVIVAVALMASLRAVGTLTDGSAALRDRMLAQWSAENRLAQMRIEAEWPSPGKRAFACGQGGIALTCREEVFQTPNAAFRRVELSVHADSDGHRLARLVGFVTTLR